MEYYYSGTESLWCGNWNHLVCRRWRCEVDHPSQSTVVNLGKKQNLCSLWCLWSQVQHDTSGPDNFRILGCLWTKHHRCTRVIQKVLLCTKYYVISNAYPYLVYSNLFRKVSWTKAQFNQSRDLISNRSRVAYLDACLRHWQVSLLQPFSYH